MTSPSVPSQTYNFRTVRVCDRCKREFPYDAPAVRMQFVKGHKTLKTETACWPCWLGVGRLSQ